MTLAVNTLVVLNDSAYGTERSYNGLRLAYALAKREGEEVRMIGAAISRGAKVALCGTCMDARAIREDHLVEGARRSTLEELTDWTIWADKVITF